MAELQEDRTEGAPVVIAPLRPAQILLERTSPETRSPYYKDIESLVSPGFLTHTVKVGDVVLGFRSLTSTDLFMIKQRCGDGVGDLSWLTWVLATSVWMVAGWNLLEESNSVPRLARTLRHLPKRTLHDLFTVVAGLLNRQNKAVRGAEAYCYEGSSRYLWKSLGRALPDDSARGIPGASRVGLTHVQKMWVSFNMMEDDRMQSLQAWGQAKLVASASNPKGVSKISQADESAAQEEEQRRQETMDRYYYRAAGFLTEEEAERAFSRFDRPRAKSVEELEDEMRRWVSGEMDEHDLLVAEYKRQITERMAAEEQKREERIRQLREQDAEVQRNTGFEPTKLVGYTPEELQRVLGERKSGVVTVYDDSRTNPEDPVYRKHLVGQPKLPPGYHVVEDKIIYEGDQSLNEQISGRQVTFREGD